MAIKIRRGTDAERISIVFEEGEVLYTTDTKLFYIGDGVTPGGNPMGFDANLQQVTDNGNTTTNTIDVAGTTTDFVQLDTTATPTLQPGMFGWNDAYGTADLRLKGNNVTLQVGQETLVRVVNKTGADLLESQYKAVRIRLASEGGAAGQRLAVVLAKGDADLDSVTTLGIVTETILNNQEGFVTVFGNVNEINTTGSLQGETWVDGDVLYLSPTTAGSLTKVKPTAPNHTVTMGYVVYAHAVHGKIFVKVDNGYELEELHDVLPTPYINKGVLYRDTTANLWKSATIATLLGYTPADDSVTVKTTGSYSDPSWLTSLAWGKISGTPTTLGGYGITDAVPSSRTLTINGTAYDLSADRSWTISTPTLAQVTTVGNTTTNFIGLGATTPLSRLHVVGTSTTTQSIALFIENGVTYQTTTFDTANTSLRALTVQGSAAAYFVGRAVTTSTEFAMGISGASGTPIFIGSMTANDLQLRTSNATKATIFQATGNFAINTTTDAGYKLDVNGTVRVKGTGTTSATTSFTYANNLGQNLILFDDTGRIITQYYIGYANNSRGITFSDSNLGMAYQGFGGHRFLAYNLSAYVNQLVITGNTLEPKIGIGLDVPLAKFHVSGTITAATSIARGVYFNNTLIASANNDVLVGLDIAPTFTNGAFTGVSNLALRVTGQSLISGNTKIGNTVFNDVYSNLIIGIDSGGFAARGAIANASSYQDFMFVNTSVTSGNINNWSFGQRRDTYFGNTVGSFQIIGSYIDNTGTGSMVGGGYRVPLICNPNGDVILAGASANAVNGSVLIGTTINAGYKLDVNGSTRLNGSLTLGMTPIVAASIMSTHKLQISIAGTTYYLLASNI